MPVVLGLASDVFNGRAALAQVKRPTVLRWNRQGRMPRAVRLNERTLRWRPDDVQAWIEQRKGS